MTKKTDKVMAALKSRRQQEQKKLPGSEGSFNPVHVSKKSDQAPESPNQYAHRVSEALAQRGTSMSLGRRRFPNLSYQASQKGGEGLIRRAGSQKLGNQSPKGRYGFAEEEVEVKNKVLKKVKKMKEEQGTERTDKLGRPDTGGAADTVTVNPKMNPKKQELTGPLR